MFLVMKLAALHLLASLLLAQPSRFGAPVCLGPERELADHAFFLLCHDSIRKVPSWTAHELTPHRLPAATSHSRYFRHDTALAGPIARNADYRGSGYSRGHMVPAEDLAWSGEAIRSTYVLSNAVPQVQGVNAGLWRELETAVREIAARSDAVYIVTGPIFAASGIEFIGAGQVAVPTHTFKVVLALDGVGKTMYAAIVPNTAACRGRALGEFTVTVDEVERQTGLDFFGALDDDEERRLQSARHDFRGPR